MTARRYSYSDKEYVFILFTKDDHTNNQTLLLRNLTTQRITVSMGRMVLLEMYLVHITASTMYAWDVFTIKYMTILLFLLTSPIV